MGGGCPLCLLSQSDLTRLKLPSALGATSRTSMLWKQPPNFPTHTCVSNSVMNALLGMDGMRAASGYKNLYDTPVYEWPAAAVTFFDHAVDFFLLEADAEGDNVQVGSSTVPGGGRGVFARRLFEAGEKILPLWGTLVYEDLSVTALSKDAAEKHRVYGSGVLSTSATRWLQTSAEVKSSQRFWSKRHWHPGHTSVASIDVATKHCQYHCSCVKDEEYIVWLVPSTRCAAGMVNDGRLNKTPGCGDTEAEAAKRMPNVKLGQRKFPVDSTYDITRANVVHLVVTKTITVGEELYLHYGVGHTALRVSAV